MSEMETIVYILFLSVLSAVNVLLSLRSIRYHQEQERKVQAWRKTAQYYYEQN